MNNLIRPNLDLSSVLNNDEYSVAMWVKVDAYPGVGTAIRYSNNYGNGTTE